MTTSTGQYRSSRVVLADNTVRRRDSGFHWPAVRAVQASLLPLNIRSSNNDRRDTQTPDTLDASAIGLPSHAIGVRPFSLPSHATTLGGGRQDGDERAYPTVPSAGP